MACYLIVIIDPYRGLRYDEVQAFYYEKSYRELTITEIPNQDDYPTEDYVKLQFKEAMESKFAKYREDDEADSLDSDEDFE